MKRLQNDPTFRELVRSAVARRCACRAATGIDVINDGERVSQTTELYKGAADRFWRNRQADELFGPRSLSRILRTRLSQRDARPMGGCNGPVSYIGRTGLNRTSRPQVRGQTSLPGSFHERGVARESSPISSTTNITSMRRGLPDGVGGRDEGRVRAPASGRVHRTSRLSGPGDGARPEEFRQRQFADNSARPRNCASAALNRSLAGIPPEAMQCICAGATIKGPHHRDIELKDIIDIVLEARPAGIVLESCNPRHEHEWQVFEKGTARGQGLDTGGNRYRDQLRRASGIGGPADRALGAGGGKRKCHCRQ